MLQYVARCYIVLQCVCSVLRCVEDTRKKESVLNPKMPNSLEYVAVTLQHTATHCNTLQHTARPEEEGECLEPQDVECERATAGMSRPASLPHSLSAVCCSVLQRVAARCSVCLGLNAICCSVSQCVMGVLLLPYHTRSLQYVADTTRGVSLLPYPTRSLQCVAVCCSALQCVAVCCSV